jgi:hypothetical protein
MGIPEKENKFKTNTKHNRTSPVPSLNKIGERERERERARERERERVL